MDTPSDKRTGLGSSLLVRRTEPVVEPEMPKEADVSDNPTLHNLSRSSASRIDVLQAPKDPVDPPPEPSKKPIRDRCTIYLDPDVNLRLHMTARAEERDRSDVVDQILRQHLPEFKLIQNQ